MAYYRKRKYIRKKGMKKRKARYMKRKVFRRVPKSGPFPRIKNTTLLYKNPSTTISSGGILSYKTCQFAANSLYDYDVSNLLGNKQPLYFDQLLSIDGPYRQYRVNAWKTKIRILNLSDKALNIYWNPATVNSFTDTDTPTEMQNWRGVRYAQLTAQNNAKPMCTFSSFHRLRNIVPTTGTQTTQYLGSYTANPSIGISQTLLAETIDGSTATFNFAVEIEHVFYVTLFDSDAIVS